MAALAAAGASTPLPVDWPARFGLDELDQRLLAVAIGVEDPGIHVALGLLAGDEQPGRPTVALACELAGASSGEPGLLNRFGPLAPLVKHHLVEVMGGGPTPARRLVVPDRVAAQIRGDDLPDPVIVGLLVDPTPLRLPGTDAVATALFDGEQLVWIDGPTGTAGIAMAAAGCLMVGTAPLVADMHRLPAVARAGADGDRPDMVIDPGLVTDVVRRLIDEAALTGSALVLMGAELAAGSMADLLRAAIPVIGVSHLGWNPTWTNRLPPTVPAPRLTLSDREKLWQQVVPDAQVDREIVALRLTPEQIRQVAADAHVSASRDGVVAPELRHLRAAARRFGRGQNAVEHAVTIDDLVLPEHIRAEVERLLNWARYRDEVVALGPLHGRGGKGTGICALFSGSPGTGKTLAARVVADALGINLLQVELSSVVSKYVGESEKKLESLFNEAEAMNAVLFFDEADALFGARSSIKGSNDRYANQEISYLLQRMEIFDGITILATNLRGNLDPAFARRMQFIINFPDPDVDTRARLWQHHLDVADVDPDDPIDVQELAVAAELAGGDIRNVVLAAAYDAVAAGARVGRRQVATALSRELVKLGRRSPMVEALVAATLVQAASNAYARKAPRNRGSS